MVFWAHRRETSIYLLNLLNYGYNRKASIEKAQEPNSGSTRSGVQRGSRERRDLLRFMNAELDSVSLVSLRGLWEIPGFSNHFISIHIHNSYIFVFVIGILQIREIRSPAYLIYRMVRFPRPGVPCSYILIKPRLRHVFVKRVHLLMSPALLERSSGWCIGIIM